MSRAERRLGAAPRLRAGEWLLWLALTALITLLLILFRGTVDKAHVALTYLLTPMFGLMGAGAATTITTLVRSYLLTTSMRTALGLSLAPWRPRRVADAR